MKKISIKKIAMSVLGLVFAFVTVFACINISTPAIAQDAIDPVAVENVNIQMEDGASVRVADDGVYGLKFTATISAKDYLGLLANTDYSFVEFGMFIMPYDYVATYGDLTEANLFGDSAVYDWATWENDEWVYNGEKTQIIKIYAYDLKETENGAYEIAGSVANIKEENIARNFVARAYVQADDTVKLANYYNGEQGNNVNSIAYVAQKAVQAFEGNESFSALSTWLTENYINKSVVDTTKTDFGYIDRSSTASAYNFKLANGVKATRITTDNYVEVPFTCENGVISIDKAVVDGGLTAGALATGENFLYIHTVDNNGEKPVYSVNKVCVVIEDSALATQYGNKNLFDDANTFSANGVMGSGENCTCGTCWQQYLAVSAS